jgi:hypothetical protein
MKLEYYHGRAYERVVQGDEAWDWAIEISGDVLIRNKDKRRTAAPDSEKLEGTSLVRTAYSDTSTMLEFGISGPQGYRLAEEVVFTPSLYTLADPSYEMDEETYPQREQEAEVVSLHDPWAENAVDGPVSPPDVSIAPGVGETTP